MTYGTAAPPLSGSDSGSCHPNFAKHPLYRKRSEQYVQRKVNQDDKGVWLGKVLTTTNPRKRLVEEFVPSLVAGSLQSGEKVLSVGELFGLKMRDLIDNPQFLDAAFTLGIR